MSTFSYKEGICKWLAKMSLTVCKCWQGTNSFRRCMHFTYFNSKKKISKHFQFQYGILLNQTHAEHWQQRQVFWKYQTPCVLTSRFSPIALLSLAGFLTPKCLRFEDLIYRLSVSAYGNHLWHFLLTSYTSSHSVGFLLKVILDCSGNDVILLCAADVIMRTESA